MLETSPLLLPKPETSCQAACPPGAPQPAVPGQGHIVSVYMWVFSNTAGS